MAGRKPLGSKLVDHLAGSEGAKARLAAILRTLAGELTIAEACAQLGIGEAMFHRLRNEALQAGLAELEPRALGRPPRTVSPESAQVAQLEQQMAALRLEVKTAEVKAELAHVLTPRDANPAAKKKLAQARRKQLQRRQSRAKARPRTPPHQNP